MSDTTAPVLLGFTLPSVIDLRSGDTSFSVGVQAQDEPGGSGIRHVSVVLKTPYWGIREGYTGINQSFFFDDRWDSDNFHDATPTAASATLKMSNLTRSGSYEVARVVVTDWANNTTTYDTGQLQALGFSSAITVTNGLVDTAAPDLVSLKLPTSVDLSAGFSQQFPVEAFARDIGGASVRSLTISFDKPLSLGNGLSNELRLETQVRVEDFVHSRLALYPSLSGKTPPGVYNITNVRITDFQDNTRDVSAAQLQALGIETGITISGNPVQDPPAVPPKATLSWTMAEQGLVLTVAPESWGAGQVNSVGLFLERDANADSLEGVAMTGGAAAAFSVSENIYETTIVGKSIAGIGPAAGIALSLGQVHPASHIAVRLAGFTVNGVEQVYTGPDSGVVYYRGTDAAEHIDRSVHDPLSYLIDGRGGHDVLHVNEARGNFRITKSDEGFLLGSIYGYGTRMRLANVERIVFDDGQVALDTDGAPGQLYRLYQAAFDRAPDPGGFGHWLGRMEAGDSLERIAGYFVASKEFIDLTGAATGDRDFVTALYDNVLHRQPDATGLDFWTGVLGRGAIDRTQLLVQFSESAENVAQLVAAIQHGIDFMP